MSEKKMDKHSWGNSSAAIALVSMLETEEYQPYSKKVRGRLTTQWQRLDALMKIEEPGIRRECLIAFHRLFRKHISEMDIPDVLKTYVLCVATSRYRQLASVNERVYVSPTALHNLKKLEGEPCPSKK